MISELQKQGGITENSWIMKRPDKDQEKDINIMKHTPKTLLTLIFIGFLMTSCVSKKKLKESQDLQSTYILDQTEKKWTNSVQNIKSELSESILSKFNETIKSFKESSSTNENETTDVTVNITAEDGKEKSATVGNTTVTSNGADISVKTSSTKAINNQIETLNSEWSQKYDILETSIINVTNELNEFKTAQLKVNEELKAEKNTQSKETDKKGLSFWAVIIAIVLAVLFVAYNIYSKRLF